MGKNKEFDNILNECLERILTRGETIEQCLASYPEQAAELEPLLQTALLAKETVAIKPRPEFKERARYQLRAVLQEMEEKKRRRFSFFNWQPRWANVVIAVIILLLASSGTVAAASGSMPDDTLYPVKLAAERVRLALTPSALGKAELYAKLADKRVAEIIKMANEGKLEQMEQTIQRLNTQLMAMVSLVGPVEGQPSVQMAPPVVTPEAAAPPAAERPPERRPGLRMVPAPPPLKTPTEEEAGVWMAPGRPVPEQAPALPEVREEGDAKVDRRAKLRMIVARNAARHPAALQEVLEKVPESARPAILRAIMASKAEYEKVLKALEEENKDKD